MIAYGYIRVSTTGQDANGSSLASQRLAIEEECERRGWDLQEVFFDVASGGKRNGRPGLADALEATSRAHGALVVAKLDRLSRSLVDFATVLERSRKEGWSLVALDLQVDTSSPHGEFFASIMASMAQWERRMISQRTKEGLAQKKLEGVRIGRPRTLDETTRQRILFERALGRPYLKIAQGLERDAVPTAQGGRWQSNTVRGIYLAG